MSASLRTSTTSTTFSRRRSWTAWEDSYQHLAATNDREQTPWVHHISFVQGDRTATATSTWPGHWKKSSLAWPSPRSFNTSPKSIEEQEPSQISSVKITDWTPRLACQNNSPCPLTIWIDCAHLACVTEFSILSLYSFDTMKLAQSKSSIRKASIQHTIPIHWHTLTSQFIQSLTSTTVLVVGLRSLRLTNLA